MNFINKLLQKIRKSKHDAHIKELQKELDDLTNGKEYQAILKKHNLKPVDFLKQHDY